MKKLLSLMLALVMVLSLAACGSGDEDTVSGGGNKMDIELDGDLDLSGAETVDSDKVGASMDFDMEVPDLDYDHDPIDAVGATIGFDMDVDLDISYEHDPIEAVGATIDLSGLDFDWEITYTPEPITATPASIGDFIVDTDIADFKSEISANVTTADLEAIDSMDAAQIEKINTTRANLMMDLYNAFAEAEIAVTMDKSNGIIAFDSAVLFGNDESAVSGEGGEFLAKFMDVYTSVILSEKYTDFVSAILVEGHTDTNGDYDYNMKLSQARADNVRAYCLEEEMYLSQEHVERLNEMLVAVGYSYDNPVYNEDGTVNMEASRRVSFRFLINFSEY